MGERGGDSFEDAGGRGRDVGADPSEEQREGAVMSTTMAIFGPRARE